MALKLPRFGHTFYDELNPGTQQFLQSVRGYIYLIIILPSGAA